MVDLRLAQIAAFFTGILLCGAAGCGGNTPPAATAAGTTSAAAGGGGLLISGDETKTHRQVIDALGPKHDCVDNPKGIACDAKKENAFTFAVAFADSPRRAVFVIPSKMKVPCEQAAPRFNALNRQFETVTLTCEGDGFAAVGVLMIPEAGLSAKDISSYADGWLTQVATVFVANHLGEIVN